MIYLWLTLLFVLIQAFFSGIEVGLISLLKPRVRHGVKEKHCGAWILDFFMQHPGFLLSTTLIGTNICVVCSATMAKKSAEFLGYSSPSAILVTMSLMTLILLAAEIIPKDWFRQQPYERCRAFSYVLYGFFILLFIPIYLMSRFTGFINRMIGGAGQDDTSARALMREDFRILLRESEDAGIIDPEAADILDRSLEFHSLRVGNILRNRGEVKEIPATVSVAEAVAFCREQRVSRVPVFIPREDSERDYQWSGIFYVYDAFFSIAEEQWSDTKITACLRPAVVIAADSRMDDVLVEAKLADSSLLIVTPPDDSTRHIGIVTPIDVAKNLFG